MYTALLNHSAYFTRSNYWQYMDDSADAVSAASYQQLDSGQTQHALNGRIILDYR